MDVTFIIFPLSPYVLLNIQNDGIRCVIISDFSQQFQLNCEIELFPGSLFSLGKRKYIHLVMQLQKQDRTGIWPAFSALQFFNMQKLSFSFIKKEIKTKSFFWNLGGFFEGSFGSGPLSLENSINIAYIYLFYKYKYMLYLGSGFLSGQCVCTTALCPLLLRILVCQSTLYRFLLFYYYAILKKERKYSQSIVFFQMLTFFICKQYPLESEQVQYKLFYSCISLR